jgi:hypothetical protein
VEVAPVVVVAAAVAPVGVAEEEAAEAEEVTAAGRALEAV